MRTERAPLTPTLSRRERGWVSGGFNRNPLSPEEGGQVEERLFFAVVRGARSLPEGSSLAPRERERGEGPGERSRPHPAESLAGA